MIGPATPSTTPAIRMMGETAIPTRATRAPGTAQSTRVRRYVGLPVSSDSRASRALRYRSALVGWSATPRLYRRARRTSALREGLQMETLMRAQIARCGMGHVGIPDRLDIGQDLAR